MHPLFYSQLEVTQTHKVTAYLSVPANESANTTQVLMSQPLRQIIGLRLQPGKQGQAKKLVLVKILNGLTNKILHEMWIDCMYPITCYVAGGLMIRYSFLDHEDWDLNLSSIRYNVESLGKGSLYLLLVSCDLDSSLDNLTSSLYSSF